MWLEAPEDVGGEKFQEAFRSYFGARWQDVFDAAEKSAAYNEGNSGYFSVCNLKRVEDLSLEELLEKIGPIAAPNIIAS